MSREFTIVRTYHANSTLGVVLEDNWGRRFARLIGGTEETAAQRVAAAFGGVAETGDRTMPTVDIPCVVNGRTWAAGLDLGVWDAPSYRNLTEPGVRKYRRALNERIARARRGWQDAATSRQVRFLDDLIGRNPLAWDGLNVQVELHELGKGQCSELIDAMLAA